MATAAQEALRILIVGSGEIARLAHIPALSSRPEDWRIVGLVDVDFTREEVAQAADAAASTSSPALKFLTVRDAFEYFGRDIIDAVSILTLGKINCDCSNCNQSIAIDGQQVADGGRVHLQLQLRIGGAVRARLITPGRRDRDEDSSKI